MNVRDLSEAVFASVKGYVDSEVERLVAEAVAKAQPPRGEKGEPGRDGQDGASIKGEKGDQGDSGKDGPPGAKGDPGDQGPTGKDGAAGLPGKDGERGLPGENGKDGKPGADGLKGDPGERGEKGEPGIDGKEGAAGLQGKDGRDGLDGKDGAPGLNGKDGVPGADGQKGIDGVNGKDGAPGPAGERGLDGKSVTVEEVAPVLEGYFSKWALDFERRAGETMQRTIDRFPAPKDGADGKDGRDGLSLETFGVEVLDGGRVLRFHAAGADGSPQVSEVRTALVIDRGAFKAGQAAQTGDAFTYGGSLFVAQRDTKSDEKPEDGSGAFRLAVKRGRDAT